MKKKFLWFVYNIHNHASYFAAWHLVMRKVFIYLKKKKKKCFSWSAQNLTCLFPYVRLFRIVRLFFLLLLISRILQKIDHRYCECISISWFQICLHLQYALHKYNCYEHLAERELTAGLLLCPIERKIKKRLKQIFRFNHWEKKGRTNGYGQTQERGLLS